MSIALRIFKVLLLHHVSFCHTLDHLVEETWADAADVDVVRIRLSGEKILFKTLIKIKTNKGGEKGYVNKVNEKLIHEAGLPILVA